MSARPFSYTQLGAALVAGLALRLFFIWHFPFYSGDTKFYEELARNWMDHGVYGLYVRGALTAVDMRVPGYPAFLAAIYFVIGTQRARGDGGAGVRGSCDLRAGRADRGAAGAGFPARGGGHCGAVDGCTVPVHSGLHGCGPDGNAGYFFYDCGGAGVCLFI